MSGLRSMTMLNNQGDTTIVWTEDQDDKWERIIAKKMAEGVTFFIVEPRFFGLLPPKCTKLTKAADAKNYRALSIPDEDISKLVDDGAGETVPTPLGKVRGSRISRNAKEIASSQSVGVKPMRGG